MDELEQHTDPEQDRPDTPASEADAAFTISFDMRKTLISAFIIWQIIAVTVWLMPSGEVNFYGTQFFGPYMRVTGFWQAWEMFAPNPMRHDYYVQAHMTYADGVTRDWNIPRMHDMGQIERYQKERFRKMIENAAGSDNKTMYPYLARYAMIENDRGPGTYPVTVTLLRWNQFIVPPNPGWRTPDFVSYKIGKYTYTSPIIEGAAGS